MSGALLPHVFLMLVRCAPGANVCQVTFSHAEYPTLAMCVQVAPAWVELSNRFDKRKVAGAFCELAGQAPAPYTIARRELQRATCGQRETHCGPRHQAQTHPHQSP